MEFAGKRLLETLLRLIVCLAKFFSTFNSKIFSNSAVRGHFGSFFINRLNELRIYTVMVVVPRVTSSNKVLKS